MVRCVTGPKLSTLLKFWGVRESLAVVNSNYSLPKNHRSKAFSKLTKFDLIELFNRAKSIFRSRISKAHTDRGGNNELATVLNVAWDTTERLFRKRGLEI